MHLLTLAQTEFSMAQIALLALVVLLVIAAPALIRGARRKQKAPGRDEDTAEGLRAESRVRQTADRALVDLLEASREISAQIDVKIRVLNKLVKDADAECRRMEKLLGLCAEVKEAPGKATAIKELGEEKPETGGRKESFPLSQLHRQIAELSAAGKNPGEIARATRLSLHEVNLVLHLLTTKSEK